MSAKDAQRKTTTDEIDERQRLAASDSAVHPFADDSTAQTAQEKAERWNRAASAAKEHRQDKGG